MADIPIDGFLALPPAGGGSPVLVLHAWWGLNETIKDFCRRLAQSGFAAFAPDLYHGRTAETIPEAEALGKALDAGYVQARAEAAAAARFLGERAGGGLAVVGFSLGAFYALDLSARSEQVEAVVVYYGTGPADFSRARAAYLGHFGEADPYEPRAGVDELEAELRRAGRRVSFHHYPGTGHWFCEPDRPQAYRPEAAALAWERTVGFLREARQQTGRV